MRGRTLRVLAAAGAGSVLMVSAATAVSAGVGGAGQEGGGPRITSPATQSGVTQGETVTVAGDGCPPDVSVEIAFNGAPATSTRSDAAGAFSQSITIPTYTIPEVEEGSEASISAACGGQTASIVVAVNEAAPPAGADAGEPTGPAAEAPADSTADTPATDDLDSLPNTGADSTVVLAVLGLGLVGAGAALVRRGRAGRERATL